MCYSILCHELSGLFTDKILCIVWNNHLWNTIVCVLKQFLRQFIVFAEVAEEWAVFWMSIHNQRTVSSWKDQHSLCVAFSMVVSRPVPFCVLDMWCMPLPFSLCPCGATTCSLWLGLLYGSFLGVDGCSCSINKACPFSGITMQAPKNTHGHPVHSVPVSVYEAYGYSSWSSHPLRTYSQTLESMWSLVVHCHSCSDVVRGLWSGSSINTCSSGSVSLGFSGRGSQLRASALPWSLPAL